MHVKSNEISEKKNAIASVLKAMTETSTAISALEAKIKNKDTSPEDVKLLMPELDAKNAEFESLVTKTEEIKSEIRRTELINELTQTQGIAKGLKEVITYSDGEHNQISEQKERDFVSKTYIFDGKEGLRDYAADKGENVIDAVRKTDKEGKSSFLVPSYMRDHILTNKFVAKGAYNVLTSDASGSQSGGGSLVPTTFIPELYKIPQITDRLMDRCMVKRAIGGTAQFPKLTQSVNRWGVSASWGDEGGQISEDNPSFSRLEVSTGRLTCLSQVSEKELRVNAVGLEAEMTTMFRGAVNDAVSQAILSGSGGNNRPYGINTNTAIASGVVVHARETASQVSYKDLNALQFAVEPGVADEGMYIIKSGANGAMKYIAGLYDTYGRPVLREFFKEGLGTVPTLLGSEYMITPNNTVSLGGRGDVIFGAPQNYALAIDQDISIARSDQYAFNQGLITFRVICYFGGRPLGYSCFAVLGDVSTASSSSSSSST